MGQSCRRRLATSWLAYLCTVLSDARPAWGYEIDAHAVSDARKVLRKLGAISRSRERDRRPTAEELDKLLAHFFDTLRWKPSAINMPKVVGFAIRVSLDIDSFSWAVSADLADSASLDLVRPSTGQRRSVELNINGWVFVFIVERYGRQGSFPAWRYSFSGASRTQLLGAPYAPRRSAVNVAPINARQAAEAQLENTGFTLAWDSVNNNPPDWTLPPGALSYQDQTPVQVIARIAEAVGGVVRPSRDSDSLTVLSRYREAVWYWDQAVMDCILPLDIVSEVGGEYAPQPQWNSCYVSGTHQGVAVDVRRAGTAGELPAPDVYDDLMTDTQAGRHRGICELSKGGEQELVSLSLPLFPVGGSAPGLVLPAMLCEVRGDEGG